MIHDGRSPQLPFDTAEALDHLRARDAKLSALIDRAGAFTLQLDPIPSPFASLLESILYQQLHSKAAATIHARVSAPILAVAIRYRSFSLTRPMTSCVPRASPETRSAP